MFVFAVIKTFLDTMHFVSAVIGITSIRMVKYHSSIKYLINKLSDGYVT